MGVSYDCASILLCAEDNRSIMGFDDDDDDGHGREGDGEGEGEGLRGMVGNENSGFYGEIDFFLRGLPLQSDECLGVMVERESNHLPREDYLTRLVTGALDLSIRRNAIDWIGKVHAYYSFGPLSAYLSVNYLDRFLSSYELPQGKAWMTQLLSVACLSLAAKMEETEVPLSLDLQVGEAKYVFEARTIQRMELLVLSTLKWRMQAVTPFSFIDYFLHKFIGGSSPSKSFIFRSVELILSTHRGIDFLEFRPSEVAAAVALSVLGESQAVDIDVALTTCCNHVRKERVLRCYEVIQEATLTRNRPHKNASPSLSPLPQSPIGVLDAACRRYKSDEITVGSQANSLHLSPASKRRKLNRPSVS